MKYAALFRGINVGGNHMLPMAELVKMFEHLKCTEVCTYVNSGNVVFSAPAALAKKIPGTIAAMVGKKFGFAPAIVVRDARELAAIVKGNPYPHAAGKQLHVSFHDDGRNVYMHVPEGLGKTKIKLPKDGTMRNWNTVLKLAEMTA